MATTSRLNLCNVPKGVMRDGYAGPTAKILVPFYTYGYWSPYGIQMSLAGGNIAQDYSLSLNGLTKDIPFYKDCCTCVNV